MKPALIPLFRRRRRQSLHPFRTGSTPPPEPPPEVSTADGDLARIESGPCKLSYKGFACGHTLGGMRLSMKPLLRERKVDEHGETVVDLIHTGDDVKVRTAFGQRTMQVIRTVYAFGSEIEATVWGVGRKPGASGRATAGALVIHPLSMQEVTSKDVTFFKAVVSDPGELVVGTIGQDQVFECTFTCLPDQDQPDGRAIGMIGVPA